MNINLEDWDLCGELDVSMLEYRVDAYSLFSIRWFNLFFEKIYIKESI